MHASIRDRFPLRTRERNWDVPRVLISMKFFAFNRGLHSPIDTFLLFVSASSALSGRARHPTGSRICIQSRRSVYSIFADWTSRKK